MEDLVIAAPLAAALAAKGYESLTPVQQAVLNPEAEGRDALVSAQTGSGKTVAFGLAIAPDLLAGADRLLFADVPSALIVAPTRELALQVRRELEWLYSETGAQIASCVGGMDYRTEKRALERGAHIVVGTPGRLRDHIERRSLDLSGLKAVVLDEADEMLDLGFREDLEFILSAAPETRRTLMFSATVPKEIAELASTFQRDAMRIIAKGEAKQHTDIQYRALSVTVRDREHAIFNVLRFYEARTAIVFCKTRANVNHLLARMGNRGFQVVALSGELSQQERTHALQALRDGRARVCIATDVAARGIDLPGLELVIHADLPSNSDTLLHRSGRTGRAGAKGVSALIVTPADFKKAQRLLQGAKLVAEWGPAPSADDVQAKDDMRLLDHPALHQPVAEESEMAGELLQRFGAETVAAAFIRLWREGRSAPEVLHEAAVSIAPSAPRERGEFGEAVWFELSVGRSGRAEARWLLPKICDAGSIAKDSIGAIRVQEDRTFVQIAKAAAPRFGQQMELEPGLEMRRIEGEPRLDRPERAPGKPAPRSPRPSPRALRSEDAPGGWSPVAETADDEDAPLPPRKPYPKRDDAAPRAPKPYARRDDDKPFVKRDEAKPYTRRDDDKPYAKRDEAKPYVKRDDAKPYAKREDGDRKPYAPRPAGAKPYAKRDEGKTYTKREDGDRKPYVKRDEAAGDERKPRWGATGAAAKPKPKSAGFKSHGGASDKPARTTGFKSHKAEGRAEGGKWSGADARPSRAKPAPVRADASDTSKRFVPPKRPKS